MRGLRWFAGLWFCLHEPKDLVHRRGADGTMGRECLRCGKWMPVAAEIRERSELAQRMARQARKLQRLRRPLPASRRPKVDVEALERMYEFSCSSTRTGESK